MSNPRGDYTRIALGVGLGFSALGLLGVLLGAFGEYTDPRPALGWMIGLTFWLSIGIGMLFLVMIWHLFGAGWPVIVRRQLEHAFAAFPWLFLLFLPLVVLSAQAIAPALVWKWMDPTYVMPSGDAVSEDVLYTSKAAYLNYGFFFLRFILYFAVFTVVGGLLRKWSFQNDVNGDPANTDKALRLSALGVPLVALSATFAAFDWFMSLEFHWFSTMYGVWFFSASMRAAVAAGLLICLLMASRGYLKGIFKRSHMYLLGCLALAFTVFWAYISFSQYFLIYNANIPEETFWFNIREKNHLGDKNTWWWVSMGLVFGHFFMPFLALLWYKNKVKVKNVIAISAWILLFHLLDVYWNILPGKKTDPDPGNALGYTVREFSIHWVDVCSLIGVGGICVWAYLRSMKQARPIPVKDPRIQASLNCHE
ncbi:MAG: hypothetical protein ACFE0O_13665 [Opitutales bacterium]